MQVTFDCADPGALAAFWSQALPGYALQPPPEGFSSWEDWLVERQVSTEHWNDISAAVGDGPRLLFLKVPEPKSVKNRVHLDLQSGGGPEVPQEEQQRRVRAEVARLQALGATLVEERSEMGTTWAVMTDPEGNEFCA
ncbi:MAG: VOC family protein [Actinobacteria bacterium]|nr:VOC family protein [Actinomycetota bacterium]MCA1721890.1 VOC family protein [Actinomycetota bacterium]